MTSGFLFRHIYGPPPPPRLIAQIAVSAEGDLWALANDGTLWYHPNDDVGWVEMQSLPDREPPHVSLSPTGKEPTP